MGSIRKVEINLRETCKKILPLVTESDSGDDCLMSFNNDDDITITSSTKTKEIHVSNSTPGKYNPPEGKTTAIVAEG